MKNETNRFLDVPRTKIGWWSVGLALLFTVLLVSTANGLIRFSGFLTMILGITGGIVALIALIWKRERSWFVWLMLLPGLFAILFSLGEIPYPH